MKNDTSHGITVINALSDSENPIFRLSIEAVNLSSQESWAVDSHKHPEKDFQNLQKKIRDSNLEGGIEVRNSSIQFDED